VDGINGYELKTATAIGVNMILTAAKIIRADLS